MKKMLTLSVIVMITFLCIGNAGAATHVVYKKGQSPCVTDADHEWEERSPEDIPYTCTLYNDDGSPKVGTDYACGAIQTAVDAAGAWDTVVICPASEDNPYLENIFMTYSYNSPKWGLTVKAHDPGKNKTVIEANDPDKHVFYISAEGGAKPWEYKAQTISGLTIKGATGGSPGTPCKENPQMSQDSQPYCAGIRVYCVNRLYLYNNYLTGNNYGVIVKDTNPYHVFRVNLVGNEIYGNNIGVKLQYGNSSYIRNNRIHNNASGGVLIEESYYNEVSLNIIESNGYGIVPNICNKPNGCGIKINYVTDYTPSQHYNFPYGNEIFHNSIINNSVTQIETGNAWHDTALLYGNYWSDYNGLDNGNGGRVAGDLIGDTQVPHPGVDYDNYPRVNCYPNWPYRQKITISKDMTPADLDDFPVLVKITDQSNPIFTHASGDGHEIFFTSSDCSQRLDYEMERFTSTGTKALYAWVKIPFLSSGTDTEIFMYYGNPDAGDGQNPEGVWSNSYVMVQHLSETTGQHYDSTAEGNDSSEVNVMLKGAPGKIGGADEFTADSFIKIPDKDVDTPLDLIGGTSVTYSAWIKAWSPGQISTGGIFSKTPLVGGDDGTGYHFGFDGPNCFPGSYYTLRGTRAGMWDGSKCSPADVVTQNQWDYVVYTYDQNNLAAQVYINGSPPNDPRYHTNYPPVNSDSPYDLLIGRWKGCCSFDGLIDEVRISNVARSAEWIEAEYNNIEGSYTVFAPEEDFCYPNWAYRQKITISKDMTLADLPDFPALIKITDPSNLVFANALANGNDILFTSSNCTQKLDHEIEQFTNTGTKELDAWVKIPSLSSSSDTEIYMYYGNPNAGNSENPEGVWSYGYVMVQHLSETTGQHYDSTAEGNDSSEVNVMLKGAPGKIGGADEFGADSFIRVPDKGVETSLDLASNFQKEEVGSVTYSAWIKASSPGQLLSGGILSKTPQSGGDTGNGYHFGLYGQNCSPGSYYTLMGTRAGMWDGSKCSPANVVTEDQWDYVAYTYYANDVFVQEAAIYVNGVLYGPRDFMNNLPFNQDSPYDLLIGRWRGCCSFDGLIDEVRISHIPRSTEWIQAEYNNQNNASAYLYIGTQEQR